MMMTKKILRKLFSFFNKKLIFAFYLRKKMITEIRVVDAINYLENNNTQSVMFWTTHKCASTFISKFLSIIAEETKLRHFDYAGSVWEMGNEIKLQDPYQITTDCSFLYREYGEIYGPIRKPIDLLNIQKFNNIFFLRDPRDLIVSLYYSTGYSHTLPSHNVDKKNFINERQRIKRIGINKFFLEQIDEWVIPQFTKYKFIKENSKLSSFYKYEDLRKEPKKIIFDMITAMNISISEKSLESLAESFNKPFKKNSGIKSMNKFSHTRSGESRQFQYELDEDVIKIGNHKLSKILDYWKFEI